MNLSRSEAYLRQWHDAHVGGGDVWLSARSSGGGTSFERIIADVRHLDLVLDVACGDGTLLDLIHRAVPRARLFGVDSSKGQIARAGKRGMHVCVCCARGQELPLADASVDVVVCHMALMLMDNPERVVSEARRVLRVGGRFRAITNRPRVLDDMGQKIFSAIRPLFDSIVDKRQLPPTLGDERTYEADPLRTLVAEYFDDVSAVTFDLIWDVRRAELGPFLAESSYGFDALSMEDVAASLDRIDLPDVVPWRLPLVDIRAEVR